MPLENLEQDALGPFWGCRSRRQWRLVSLLGFLLLSNLFFRSDDWIGLAAIRFLLSISGTMFGLQEPFFSPTCWADLRKEKDSELYAKAMPFGLRSPTTDSTVGRDGTANSGSGRRSCQPVRAGDDCSQKRQIYATRPKSFLSSSSLALRACANSADSASPSALAIARVATGFNQSSAMKAAVRSQAIMT